MIKPIETMYNGYKFRSRLEARWAAYFDCINLKYEYEPEGFDFEDGSPWYIPDFYLPQVRMFAEVKPFEFTKEEMIKCNKLVIHSNISCLLLIGFPDIKAYEALEVWPNQHSLAHQTQEEKRIIKEEYVISNYCLDEGRFWASPGRFDESDSFVYGCKEAIEKVKKFKFEF